MDSISCEHLIIWLNTFEGLVGAHHSAEDLSDGLAMAEVLTQIAPEWFDTDWISKIKQDISPDNHRLKLYNLKKVMKGMIDYYSEVLFRDVTNSMLPEVSLIAEKSDKTELGKMLQLVLGCAVNCEEKEQYIPVILSLKKDVQVSLMNSVQLVLQNKSPDKLPESPGQNNDYLDMRNSLKSSSFIFEKEQNAQKIYDLEEQVRVLKEERSTLLLENEALIKGAPRDNIDGSFSETRLAQLQHLLDKVKQENFNNEAAKEEYRMQCDDKEKQIRELSQKVEQLSSLAEEARSLKDEMDVMRHNNEKLTRYEATIETYKKKLGEFSDMKIQMKKLEEKNEVYMQQTMNLEEDSRKASSLKVQVDTYKSQIHELHDKLGDTEKRCDKAEFDAKRAKDKLQSMEAENQRLKQERDILKETNEELTLNLNSEHKGNIRNSLSAAEGFGDLIQDSTYELREKVIRLEHQNKVLTLQLEEAENEKIAVLQNDLDVATEKVNILQTENRQLSQEVYEMKSQLEDLEALKSKENEETEESEKIEMQSKLQEHIDQLKQSNTELQKKKEHINDLESQTTANSSEITALRDQLFKKEEQMKEMEEKYQNYLRKAKTVIKTLDPKVATPDHQVNILKDRLQEKEKLIEHLERDHDRMKMTKEREEKLIISAWYELSLQLHRKAADDRAGSGLSFLAKQRQAASVRRSSLSPHGKASA